MAHQNSVSFHFIYLLMYDSITGPKLPSNNVVTFCGKCNKMQICKYVMCVINKILCKQNMKQQKIQTVWNQVKAALWTVVLFYMIYTVPTDYRSILVSICDCTV